MNEKRFTVDGLNIQDNSIKGRLYLLEEQGGVNALCNLINGLNNKKNRLEKENEQLRQQQQRLYNYFRDYLEDEMSAENFSEMWDNVKEDERWNDE